MSKVYVVTQGRHSAYHIKAVFDSDELAKQFIEALRLPTDDRCYDGAGIEVYDLNPHSQDINEKRRPYEIMIDYDGEACAEIDEFYNIRSDVGLEIHDHVLMGTIWADTEEHAIKIASERRAQMIANGEWVCEPRDWYVAMSFSGLVYSCYPYNGAQLGHSCAGQGRIRGYDNCLEIWVEARTQQQAKRIANEHRERLIASGEWKK